MIAALADLHWRPSDVWMTVRAHSQLHIASVSSTHCCHVFVTCAPTHLGACVQRVGSQQHQAACQNGQDGLQPSDG
jgi:hypothetical protein